MSHDHLHTEGQHCLIGVGNKLYLFLKKEEQCSVLRRLVLTKARKGHGKKTKYRTSNYPSVFQKLYFTKVQHRLGLIASLYLGIFSAI